MIWSHYRTPWFSNFQVWQLTTYPQKLDPSREMTKYIPIYVECLLAKAVADRHQARELKHILIDSGT